VGVELALAEPEGPAAALVEVPPLKPIARNSVIVTPAAIALSAIHAALETAAPRNLAGKRDNPTTRNCCPMPSSSGRSYAAPSQSPAGRMRSSCRPRYPAASGRPAKSPERRVISLVRSEVCWAAVLGQGLQNLQGKALDQRADIRGEVHAHGASVAAAGVAG